MMAVECTGRGWLTGLGISTLLSVRYICGCYVVEFVFSSSLISTDRILSHNTCVTFLNL